MSVKSEPYYWLECDEPDCGTKSTEGGDHTAWAEEHMAEEEAGNSEWVLTDEGGHFCPEHHPVHYCGVETRAMRYVDPEPAEHCEEEVSAEGERCAKHEEPDDDYAYEAWKDARYDD